MKRGHILIIDDELDFTKLLALHLQAHDYDVSVANSGEEAFEKVRNSPDLILLDVNLQEISGFEICNRLRQDKTTRSIPIIMLTARDAPQEKIEGLYIGADDYITKPFNSEELFARIEAILRRIRHCRELLKDKKRAINEIKKIIENESILPFFQPIFYLQPRRLLGFEALNRPEKDSYFMGPEALFDTAFRLGMHFELEMACHKKDLLILGEKAKKELICFNINPYLIEDPRFKDLISFYKSYTKPKRIGLELTERTAIEDLNTFFNRLKFFKEEGFKISIDDIGTGYASLSSIVELKPDFIKIDLHLIHNIHTDKVRQNLFKAIAMFCKQSGITSIAEGIEKEEELEVLIELGADAGQGYLLGSPSPEVYGIT